MCPRSVVVAQPLVNKFMGAGQNNFTSRETIRRTWHPTWKFWPSLCNTVHLTKQWRGDFIVLLTSGTLTDIRKRPSILAYACQKRTNVDSCGHWIHNNHLYIFVISLTSLTVPPPHLIFNLYSQPPLSIYQHSISPKATAAVTVFACLSLPSPFPFVLCSWYLSPFALHSLSPVFITPFIFVLLQAQVFIHKPMHVHVTHTQTHSSTSVWSRWHPQISVQVKLKCDKQLTRCVLSCFTAHQAALHSLFFD